MFVFFECAACVLVAIIISLLAVIACAIIMLLDAGRGMMRRKVDHLIHGAPWPPGMGVGGWDT